MFTHLGQNAMARVRHDDLLVVVDRTSPNERAANVPSRLCHVLPAGFSFSQATQPVRR